MEEDTNYEQYPHNLTMDHLLGIIALGDDLVDKLWNQTCDSSNSDQDYRTAHLERMHQLVWIGLKITQELEKIRNKQ